VALRATNGPAQATRSAKVGDMVEFTAKVENTALLEESVSLWVEETQEPYAFAFEPAAVGVPAKGRRALTWTWRASLPEGKPALTYRGKLVLRRTTDGSLVGSAPLDLYVSQ
jgi:hypothetical protein